MENFNSTSQGKDPELWEIAKRRSSFKSHFSTYMIMLIFFWGLWYFTGSRTYNAGLPWPVWPMFGWGIGIAFHYMAAYVNPRSNNTQKEYEKLLHQQSKNNL